MGVLQKRRERDVRIYREFNELTSNPETAKMDVAEALRRKYKYATVKSIFDIRERVSKRIEKGELL